MRKRSNEEEAVGARLMGFDYSRPYFYMVTIRCHAGVAAQSGQGFSIDISYEANDKGIRYLLQYVEMNLLRLLQYTAIFGMISA